MRPQAIRRLGADIANLHNQPLPPNYLFSSDNEDQNNLTQLDILLAGPSHTPFSEGVWKLHLSIPADYPTQPPTANFRTAIFHPNVHPETGGVCVETLKRDWDSKLTLRDVLITISCLLIQPNPDSALNAEAGSLMQEEYEMFARRARLMTSIHANVPAHLRDVVREARIRGQETHISSEAEADSHAAPVRQRRQITRARQRGRTRRSDGSPVGNLLDRRQHLQHRTQPQERDDVFQTPLSPVKLNSDEVMGDADQENSVQCLWTPVESNILSPRRPPGPPVPLGELILDSSDEAEMEPEYPPSPRKSPIKSAVKRPLFLNDAARPESSRDALQRLADTPPNLTHTPMHAFTPLEPSNIQLQPRALFPTGSADESTMAVDTSDKLDAEKLWELCGRDIRRWNRCDFDKQPFDMVAARW